MYKLIVPTSELPVGSYTLGKGWPEEGFEEHRFHSIDEAQLHLFNQEKRGVSDKKMNYYIVEE